MSRRRLTPVLLSTALSLAVLGQASADSPKTEIRGAAILDHACGKVAVKHMGLVHAGKIEEANKLGTKEMQEQWKSLPDKDRTMMTEMMKEMSKTKEDFAAEIKASGLLVVEGSRATLTVKEEHKDANGTVTSTLTQNYLLEGTDCRIAR